MKRRVEEHKVTEGPAVRHVTEMTIANIDGLQEKFRKDRRMKIQGRGNAWKVSREEGTLVCLGKLERPTSTPPCDMVTKTLFLCKSFWVVLATMWYDSDAVA